MADAFAAALAKAREMAAKVKEEQEAKRKAGDVEEGDEPDAKRPNLDSGNGGASVLTSMQSRVFPGHKIEELHIDRQHAGCIIGPEGSTIRRLEEESQCKIVISQDVGRPQRLITLTGPPEAIENAKRKLRETVEANGGRLLLPGMEPGPADPASTLPSEDYMIPSDKVGLVIGRGGETIKSLQDRSGCRLQMIQDDPQAREKPLRMTGTPESIAKVKELVRELIADEPLMIPSLTGMPSSGDIASNISQYRSVQVKVTVPRVAVGRVIGRGGETIKRVQADTGARVQFEQETTSEHRIAVISGTQAMVERAEKIIRDIISDAEEAAAARAEANSAPSGSSGGPRGPQQPPPGSVVETVNVPANKAGLIIGRGGENIRAIQEMSGAHVEMDRTDTGDSPEKLFRMTGTQEQVDKARELILDKAQGGRLPPPRSGRRESRDRYDRGGYNRGPPPQQMPGPPGGYPGYPPYYPPYPGYGYPPQQGYQGYGYGQPAAAPPASQPPPPSSESSQQQQQTSSSSAQSAQQQQQQQAAGYPTHEQYLAHKEWYNAQGYYGVPPGSQQTSQASTSSATSAAATNTAASSQASTSQPSQAQASTSSQSDWAAYYAQYAQYQTGQTQ